MRKSVLDSIKKHAKEFCIEWQAGAAFVEVESGGIGFDTGTGKLIIQFEPAWFRRYEPYAPSGNWSLNKVERQEKEWIAFNDAWKHSPESAMKSTSIGLPQIMGFHYKRLGYTTVGAMWDDAKRSEDRQIWQMFKFIATDKRLLKALKEKNWHIVATIYNGKKYKEMAKKWGREPYDVSMRKAYNKWKKAPIP